MAVYIELFVMYMRPIIFVLLLSSGIVLWLLMPSKSIVDNNVSPQSASEKSAAILNTQADVSSMVTSDSHLSSLVISNSSLKGTDIDGMYPVDEEGNLVFSKSIKYRFEYFLSTMGEFPLAQVLQMVRDDIQLNLQDPAKQQALTLFDDYVAYKYALAELEGSFEAAADYERQDIQRLRFQLQQLRDKRREYLPSEAVDAFFGFDELYDDFMLSSLEIKHSSQLSDGEKESQLESLQQSLPAEVKNMREETSRVSDVFKVTQNMKNSGASQQDVFDYNSQEFGQEAAQRLQALDDKRQVWQQKVDSFLVNKKNILSDDSLTEVEKSENITQLKNSQFSQQEKIRLPAFELINEPR